MKNIDTSKWAEFKLGDICNIVRGRTKVINKLSYGDIPVISSGRKNQGIVGNYNLEAEYSDTLTIACNGSCGSTFYHDGPFAITGDASVCLFKDNLPYSIKLFIASILDEYLTQKYNYEQKCSPEILKSETIKLPAMKQYTPDWHQLNELTDCKFGGVYDMSSINTSEWKEFKIGDLFEIKPTKNYGMSNNSLFESEGNVPVIVNSAINNGVGGYVGLEPTEEGNCITFSDTTDANSIFYQPVPFVGYSHVQCMRPLNDDLPENIMRFIASVFKSAALSYNFDYSNKFRRDIALEMYIKLPARSDVEPDWEYMEKYMKDIEEEVIDKISKMESANELKKQNVNCSTWKEFNLGDLFDIKLAKGDIQPNLVSEGKIPLVSAGNENNGIVKYIDSNGDGVSEMFCSGCITISMFGKAFYQTEPFYAVSHGRINILEPRYDISENVGLLLSTIINRLFLGKYGYATMCTRTRIEKEAILLPAKSDTEPDWEYMEAYVAELMKKAESNVDKFKDIVEK